MKDSIQIYIVSHSLDDIKTIKQDDLYTPLFVGRNGKENYGFLTDDTGDNISYKNQYYSELTALYWMCKNSPYEVIGLDHYRRYFAMGQFARIINKEEVGDILSEYDLIIPQKTELLRGTVYEEFSKNDLSKKLFVESQDYINRTSPDYSKDFETVMDCYKICFFNMFVGSKEIMNEYCNWIFPILDHLIETIDISSDKRILGFLSEILFNVWIEHNNLRVYECPLRYKGFKLRLKMFLINLKVLRWGYKHIYYPLKNE